jgi:hypothetical protein
LRIPGSFPAGEIRFFRRDDLEECGLIDLGQKADPPSLLDDFLFLHARNRFGRIP